MTVLRQLFGCREICIPFYKRKNCFLTTSMSAKKPKQISGPEFQGRENIEFADIDDWITTGGAEATIVTLDNHNWNGDAVMTVELRLSPDNKKVVNG